MRAALLALALASALAGCSAARTELVLVVEQSGLALGTQIDGLRSDARDAAGVPMAPTNSTFDLLLCSNSNQENCHNFPITVTLVPGPDHLSDPVHVQVDALLNHNPKISESATFTFARGVSLRLDITLYERCYGRTDCGDMDQVCDENGNCMMASPQPFSGEPDLAVPDLGSGPVDLGPRDLAGADLTSCCVGRQCGVDPACGLSCGGCTASTPSCNASGKCVACGMTNQVCCATGTPCQTPATCNGGLCTAGGCTGAQGTPCCQGNCQTGLACDPTTTCQPCGNSGQLCCPTQTACSGVTLTCNAATGHCVPCGGHGQTCCAGGACNAPTMDVCVAPSNTCDTCGGQGYRCCAGSVCDFGLRCNNGTCQTPTVDMSAPLDQSTPIDLTTPFDFARPIDLLPARVD